MAKKNKRKPAAGTHNIHSYFGKKGRVDDGLEQNNLVDEPDAPPTTGVHMPSSLDEQVLEEEITVAADAAPTEGVQQPPVQRNNDDSAVMVVERDPGLRCQISDYPPTDQEKARLAYMHYKKYAH